METVRLTREGLGESIPVIGFAGAPFTLASYAIEGGGSRNYLHTKTLMYRDRGAWHALLSRLARSVARYLNAQIAAGAQVVQIFDTWGGALSHAAYEEFSLRYMRQVIGALTREQEGRTVPVILFTKGGGLWLEQIAASGCHAAGLDWTVDLGDARRRVGQRIALQGNMDPAILRASPSAIDAEVQRILASYGSGTGHVFNLGHGITPDIAPDHARAFIDAVHRHSAVGHR